MALAAENPIIHSTRPERAKSCDGTGTRVDSSETPLAIGNRPQARGIRDRSAEARSLTEMDQTLSSKR